jgi:hypothetical protein
MTRKKKTDRTDVIRALQSRGTLPDEERPIVFVASPEQLSAEEAAKYSEGPWIPRTPEQLRSAALDTFQRTLGGSLSRDIPQLLDEMKYKMEGAEYHLRKVTQRDHSEWWEAEAFVNQARATLEILARILNSCVRGVPDSFDSDGIPIANALTNQPTRSSHYHSSVSLAELIKSEPFIRSLSAVRSTTYHRYGLPSLAKANTGTVHLGGLDLDQFCIGIWLALMPFAKRFLEWTITIAWEMRTHEQQSAAGA